MSGRRAAVAVLLLAIAGAAGYRVWQTRAGATDPRQATTAKARPAAPVLVAAVTMRSVPINLSTIGNVQAYASVSVKSRVDGQIMAVDFHEGQAVKAGDLLFTIDPRPFEASLHQAEANLARDQAQLANARIEVKRYARLAPKGFASTEQYDQAKASMAALEATIRADQAAIESASLQLGYTRIRSPIDGVTGNLLVNAGNLVKANDTQALVVINTVHPVYVSFTVPEQYLPRIRSRAARARLPVTVSVPGDQGAPVDGELTFINNAVDSSTGTIQLKGTFANRNGRLTPGQFVNVQLTVATLAGAIVVPSQAVQAGQAGAYVYVVGENDKAELRHVRTGPAVGGITVIEQGLKPGEHVVTDGQLRLAPGVPVSVK